MAAPPTLHGKIRELKQALETSVTIGILNDLDAAATRLEHGTTQNIQHGPDTVTGAGDIIVNKIRVMPAGKSIYDCFYQILYGNATDDRENKTKLIKEYLDWTCPTADPILHIIFFMTIICETLIYNVEREDTLTRVIFKQVSWRDQAGNLMDPAIEMLFACEGPSIINRNYMNDKNENGTANPNGINWTDAKIWQVFAPANLPLPNQELYQLHATTGRMFYRRNREV